MVPRAPALGGRVGVPLGPASWGLQEGSILGALQGDLGAPKGERAMISCCLQKASRLVQPGRGPSTASVASTGLVGISREGLEAGAAGPWPQHSGCGLRRLGGHLS